MNNMTEDGILRKVNGDSPKRCLPLHAIVDLNRKSTKVRICLDAKGISLNGALRKGKMLGFYAAFLMKGRTLYFPICC